MLPFFIMARLLLLLFTSLLSFNLYASNFDTKSEAVKYLNGLKTQYDGLGFYFKITDTPAVTGSSYNTLRLFWSGDGSKWNFERSAGYLSSGNDLPNCSDYNSDLTCKCSEDQVNQPDGTCAAPPEPHSCPVEGTFYKRLHGGESLNGYSTCLPENCVVELQFTRIKTCIESVSEGVNRCDFNLFYTGQTCSYDPNNEGLNPPDHIYPEDPVQPPAPDTPDITDLPDGEGGGLPVYDPDDDGLPDDPVNPPNPDPQPDPDDPNLTTGENAIVGELSEANQRLENIDHVLQDLTNTTKADNDAFLAYQAQFLGQMTEINRELDEGGLGSGGGGGGGTGTGEGEGTCEEDCVPVNFPGAPEVVDPFAEILDETDINDIITRTEDTKTQLEAKMNNFKGLFSVPNYGAGGTITPIEFDLQHRDTTIPVKFGIFDTIAPDIASIITLIAAVICFLIVTTRR